MVIKIKFIVIVVLKFFLFLWKDSVKYYFLVFKNLEFDFYDLLNENCLDGGEI